MADVSKWQKISETYQKVGWRSLTTKLFTDPSGKQQTFVTWNRPDQKNAAVIALTKDTKIVIARQFRQGPENVLWELPGGEVGESEEPGAAALRELHEETGYTTDKPLTYLGEACRDCYRADTTHYYLAHDCYKADEPHPDAGEYVETELIPIAQLINNARTNKMSDGVAVLLAYDELLSLEKEAI